MLLRLAMLMLLAALVVPNFFGVADAAPRQPAPKAAVSRIVELVNARRAAAGLPRVTVHPTLMAEAQRFSGVQAQLGRLSHRGVDGTTAGQRLTRAGYRWSFYGENLAAGQQTPDAVFTAWMASPTHRANIMHPRARQIGIGYTYRPNDPARYIDYWVMELGRPR